MALRAKQWASRLEEYGEEEDHNILEVSTHVTSCKRIYNHANVAAWRSSTIALHLLLVLKVTALSMCQVLQFVNTNAESRK